MRTRLFATTLTALLATGSVAFAQTYPSGSEPTDQPSGSQPTDQPSTTTTTDTPATQPQQHPWQHPAGAGDMTGAPVDRETDVSGQTGVSGSVDLTTSTPTMIREPALTTENADLSMLILALNNVTLNTYLAALQEQRGIGIETEQEALEPERDLSNDRDLDGVDDSIDDDIDDSSSREMNAPSSPSAPIHTTPAPSVEP
jgi:hypothetical protein